MMAEVKPQFELRGVRQHVTLELFVSKKITPILLNH